jgi:hypothetical protein
MTDESRIRATRPHGLPQAQQASAGRVRRTEDPLAELARLIGQDDPFADFVAHRPADNRAGGHAAAPRRPRAQEGRSYDTRANERRRPPSTARPSEFEIEDATDSPDTQSDAKRGTYAYGGGRAPRADTAPAVTNGVSPEPAPVARDARRTSTRDEEDQFTPRRGPQRMADDVSYDAYDGGDYDPDYADDAYLPAHGDEFYDEAPRRRLKGWMMVGIAAVAAIVVGTSGLFAYRAIFGPTNTAAAPKMIRSETAPTKMVPGSTTQADNKPGQDRIGGEAAKSERIVSREERPIDPNRIPQGDPIARIAAGGTVSASPPMTTQSAPAAESGPIVNASTEPRRVRTVTVRSDGSVVNNPAAATTATQATRQPVPTTGNPLALQGGQSPSAAMPPQRPSPGDNPWANLSGQPQSAGSQQQAALPPQPQAAPAIAVNTPQPAGSYVVQVAAQKSEAEAQSSWQALQQRYGTVLAGQQATIRRVDLGERGVFYRAQVGPFSTRAQASEVCQSLKAAGGECVIQRN